MPDTETTLTGLVKWYNQEKGYGFIQAEGLDTDVFMHIKQLRASGITAGLTDGEKVRFVVNTGPKGKFATNISRLNGASHAPSVTSPT